jgi:hypothetical protein
MKPFWGLDLTMKQMLEKMSIFEEWPATSTDTFLGRC